MPVKTTRFIASLRNEYKTLYSSLEIKASKQTEINFIVNRILTNRVRYQQVADVLNMPWYFIAITHQLEASGKFNTHLHNGDPLTARTVQIPKGRPRAGFPPFTWEESAMDALEYEGFKNNPCWSLSALLYRFERYNGFGYRRRTSINSPYLWSYSNHYTSGKYVKDGIFDSAAVSKQPGTVVLLKALELNANAAIRIEKEPEQRYPQLFKVVYAPSVVNSDAMQLQLLLNSFGYNLNPDGKAGKMTSDAVFEFSGKHLAGDPRQ